MKGCNLVLIRPFVVNLALVGDHLVVVVVVVVVMTVVYAL